MPATELSRIQNAVVEQKRLRKAAEARANIAEAALSIALRSTEAASSGVRDGWRVKVARAIYPNVAWNTAMRTADQLDALGIADRVIALYAASPIPPSASTEPMSDGRFYAEHSRAQDPAGYDAMMASARDRIANTVEHGEYLIMPIPGPGPYYFEFQHSDYDPENNDLRHGYGSTVDDCKQQIADLEFERSAIKSAPPEPSGASQGEGTWECFSDPSYYDMWAVRLKGETRFHQVFHLFNGDEAKALVDVLNRSAPPVTGDQS